MVQYSLPPRSSDPDSVELAVDRVSLALAKDFKYFLVSSFYCGRSVLSPHSLPAHHSILTRTV